jgi:predicted dienelactone hydrolase
VRRPRHAAAGGDVLRQDVEEVLSRLLAALMALALSAVPAAATTIGFQRITVPDSDARPREVGLWYPSDGTAAPAPLGPYRQTVAVDGTVAGRQLPLVVVLHGVQGSFANHYDTALALADAGFVVAAITHDDDVSLLERPRHVTHVLDYLLGGWPAHARLDPARVGVYGFSVGGFAALVTAGGVPDFGRIPAYCAQYPDRVCGMLKARNIDTSVPASAWSHDSRVKAAVVAAPTLAFTFDAAGLAPIRSPIQLWRPEQDEITPHPRGAEAIYHALPTRPQYVVVPRAGHFVFVACSAELAERAPAVCRDAPDFDRPAFHRELNVAIVDFFKAQLTTR